ncbi:MAG: hypothetical protein AAF985_01880 [Bacteroidota bacterium]
MLRRYWRHPLPYLIALLVSLLYYYTPSIVQWLILQPTLRSYAYQDTRIVVNAIQKALMFPLGDHLNYGPRLILIFPYWVLLMICFRGIYLHTRSVWKYILASGVLVFLGLLIYPNSLLWLESSEDSASIGHVNSGQILYSKRMPFHGVNFSTYSYLGYFSGRTFVHGKVRKTLLDTYQSCQTSCPGIHFILGETGDYDGGLFVPHTAHQNGMSVDFMVPLRKEGKAYRGQHLFNLWGYSLRFDPEGKCDDLRIDFETIAKHLWALNESALANELVLQKIRFNPALQEKLFATESGKKIRDLPFWPNREVMPHDNHYHVDFGLRPKEFSKKANGTNRKSLSDF